MDSVKVSSAFFAIFCLHHLVSQLLKKAADFKFYSNINKRYHLLISIYDIKREMSIGFIKIVLQIFV